MAVFTSPLLRWICEYLLLSSSVKQLILVWELLGAFNMGVLVNPQGEELRYIVGLKLLSESLSRNSYTVNTLHGAVWGHLWFRV